MLQTGDVAPDSSLQDYQGRDVRLDAGITAVRATLLLGDCLDVLSSLPDQSVHCCITSPPYWEAMVTGEGINTRLGMEPSLEEYVANLARIFRELRRALWDEGAFFLIIGDPHLTSEESGSMPWQVAAALQSDGWQRSKDLIWVKSGGIHDYVFLFTKTDQYYYNAEALPGDVIHALPEEPPAGYGYGVTPENLIEPILLAGSAEGSTVLDPFCGSGSTGRVALRHGRNFIGIDVKADYLEIARQRLQEAAPSASVSVSSPDRETQAQGPTSLGTVIPGVSAHAPRPVAPGAGSAALAAPSGVRPGQGGERDLVFAIGDVGYDFGTEARRDSFTQLMPAPTAGVPPNPTDSRQLASYLEQNPYEAASLIWTLNLDNTPAYAIAPTGAFASLTYELLRQFLGATVGGAYLPVRLAFRLGQAIERVKRVSIPGVISGSARLYSGQVVPVIAPEYRGMYGWSTEALARELGPLPEDADQEAIDALNQRREEIGNLLDRIYYEFRNLGRTSRERAINYSGTNAYQGSRALADALQRGLELDAISAEPSPFCRPDSDCWDVVLTFFNPRERLTVARRMVRFTVDVSDVMPVTVGLVRSWSMY